jgi:hypothetical protein
MIPFISGIVSWFGDLISMTLVQLKNQAQADI